MPWFLAQNAPKCVWRPGSSRTRWGSLSAPPDIKRSPRPPSRKKGSLLLRGGDRRERWKGGERRGRKGRGGKGGVEGRERGRGGKGKGERRGPSWLVANEAFFLKSTSVAPMDWTTDWLNNSSLFSEWGYPWRQISYRMLKSCLEFPNISGYLSHCRCCHQTVSCHSCWRHYALNFIYSTWNFHHCWLVTHTTLYCTQQTGNNNWRLLALIQLRFMTMNIY